MSQQDPPVAEDQDVSDTSDRLYTTHQLSEYAAQQTHVPPPVHGDPLTDPLPAYPVGPPPAAPPATESPVAAPPAQAPPAPPPSWSPPPTSPPPAAAPPDVAPPAVPASAPEPAAQAQLAPPPPSASPAATHAVPAAEPATEESFVPEPDGDDPDVRRFMTATDFLDRRDSEKEHGPASWGWRGRMRRWSGGLIAPKMGTAELEHEDNRRAIQRDFDGPRTIAFINPKGGAAKTTGVLAAGYTFGTVRGGGVVAWDNNETRGTLGIRGTRSTHRNTTRELLEDLERFSDVYQSRIGDLGAFVRSQGDAHFDVLASDERPDVTGTIRADDFNAVHRLLERFYRVILVDTGNNMRAENWLASADAADLLVITSTVREDTGYSGLWMMDALQDAGMQNLKYKAITILSDPSPQVDSKLAHDLVQVYEQRTRAVYRVPYDPVLVSGSVVPYARLSGATKSSWLRACAGMAAAL
jgi:MinD-like ATPase involved in chromosome partitioning or flagellar assembly